MSVRCAQTAKQNAERELSAERSAGEAPVATQTRLSTPPRSARSACPSRPSQTGTRPLPARVECSTSVTPGSGSAGVWDGSQPQSEHTCHRACSVTVTLLGSDTHATSSAQEDRSKSPRTVRADDGAAIAQLPNPVSLRAHMNASLRWRGKPRMDDCVAATPWHKSGALPRHTESAPQGQAPSDLTVMACAQDKRQALVAAHTAFGG